MRGRLSALIILIFSLAIIGVVLSRNRQPSQPKDNQEMSSDAGTDQDSPKGLLTRSIKVGGRSYTYQVYIPTRAQADQKLPMILLLHGIGQRGEGGIIPAAGSASEFARLYLEQVPAILVLPQCRKDRYWHDADMEEMAISTVDQAAAEFRGDAERLYLIGVSMGGYGAWHIASRHPEKFAAVVPICGGSPLRATDRFAPIASKLGKVPVWVFHGADDRIVPVSESRNMVRALKAVNGNVRYSEYAGVGHNVWFNVLAEPGLLPWLLSQRVGS